MVELTIPLTSRVTRYDMGKDRIEVEKLTTKAAYFSRNCNGTWQQKIAR